MLHYNLALSISKTALGKAHVSVADTSGNIGIVEETLGNHEKARELYEQALQIRLKSLRQSPVSVAGSYG